VTSTGSEGFPGMPPTSFWDLTRYPLSTPLYDLSPFADYMNDAPREARWIEGKSEQGKRLVLRSVCTVINPEVPQTASRFRIAENKAELRLDPHILPTLRGRRSPKRRLEVWPGRLGGGESGTREMPAGERFHGILRRMSGLRGRLGNPNYGWISRVNP
jgi:hypothetical protein